jgi:superkiller protein 3
MTLELRFPEPLSFDPPPFLAVAASMAGGAAIPDYAVVPGSPAAEAYFRAREFDSIGDWDRAREAYRRLAEISRDLISYFLFGAASYRIDDLEAAGAAYRKAAKAAQKARKDGDLVPADIEAMTYFGLCLVHLRYGRLDEALREIRAAVRLNEHDKVGYFLLGYIQVLRGQMDLAVSAYERAIQIDSNFREAYLYLSKLYANQASRTGRREYLSKAVATLERLVQYFPNTDVYNNTGVLLGRIGNMASAMEAYQKAVELDPFNLLALSNLGTAYLAVGRAADAKKTFERAIESFQDASSRGELLARQYLGLGVAMVRVYQEESARNLALLHEAQGAYERSIEIDPGNAIAHSNLAAVHAELGNLEAAQSELTRAVQLDPEDEQARGGLAHILALRYSPEDPSEEKGSERIRRSLDLLDNLLEGDEEEQRQTFASLKKSLEENRLSNRRLFSD